MRGFRSPTTAFGPSRSSSKKPETLSGDEPEQRALCRLLTYLVGSYIEDEEFLPVAVADRLYQRPLDLAASLDFRASADHRVADLNRVAALIV
jgi:hypothetical protein